MTINEKIDEHDGIIDDLENRVEELEERVDSLEQLLDNYKNIELTVLELLEKHRELW